MSQNEGHLPNPDNVQSYTFTYTYTRMYRYTLLQHIHVDIHIRIGKHADVCGYLIIAYGYRTQRAPTHHHFEIRSFLFFGAPKDLWNIRVLQLNYNSQAAFQMGIITAYLSWLEQAKYLAILVYLESQGHCFSAWIHFQVSVQVSFQVGVWGH